MQQFVVEATMDFVLGLDLRLKMLRLLVVLVIGVSVRLLDLGLQVGAALVAQSQDCWS